MNENNPRATRVTSRQTERNSIEYNEPCSLEHSRVVLADRDYFLGGKEHMYMDPNNDYIWLRELVRFLDMRTRLAHI